jgi:hypothetical protein
VCVTQLVEKAHLPPAPWVMHARMCSSQFPWHASWSVQVAERLGWWWCGRNVHAGPREVWRADRHPQLSTPPAMCRWRWLWWYAGGDGGYKSCECIRVHAMGLYMCIWTVNNHCAPILVNTCLSWWGAGHAQRHLLVADLWLVAGHAHSSHQAPWPHWRLGCASIL